MHDDANACDARLFDERSYLCEHADRRDETCPRCGSRPTSNSGKGRHNVRAAFAWFGFG